MTLAGMLINPNRTAFMRRLTHDSPNTKFFIAAFRFRDKIMIHHQAAFPPKSPLGIVPPQPSLPS